MVLVTEPTVSGLHDLKRVHELVQKFNIPAGCIINKADLNPQIAEKILNFLKHEKIVHISSLPYDESFTKAMVNGQTIIEFNGNPLSEILSKSWDRIKQRTK